MRVLQSLRPLKLYAARIPIPVISKMRSYLNSIEPQLARILVATWNAQREAIKFEELLAAVQAGALNEGMIAEWKLLYSKMVADKLVPLWEAEIEAAAMGVVEAVNKMSIPAEFVFSRQWAWINKYTSTNGSRLITELTADQFAAISGMMRHFLLVEPMPAVNIARFIRANIGLHERWSNAVVNYRAQLLKRDPTMALGKLDKLVQKKADFLLRRRAENIARTETARAWSHAQQDTMRQAMSENLFPGKRIMKRWLTAQDERTCSICADLDGQIEEIDGTYTAKDGVYEATYPADIHPGCRCDEIYYVEEA